MHERLQGLHLSLVYGGRDLTAGKHVGPVDSTISTRLDRDRFLVTPAGKGCDELEVDELVEVEIDSPVAPEGSSTDVGLHRAIYERFRWVYAVVHARPEKVIALAGEGRAPDPAHLPGGGSVLDKVSWIDDFAPGSRSLADEVVKGIALAPSLVIAAHGAVTVGSTVDQAVLRMIRLERLALLTRGR